MVVACEFLFLPARFDPPRLGELKDHGVRSSFRQDRQDPSALSRVFLAGATAGGMCALLQTPVRLVFFLSFSFRRTDVMT